VPPAVRAALHVAAWHNFEPDPEQDAYLQRLIAAAHREGIQVYAWLELPHVSEKFWAAHPEWREKTERVRSEIKDRTEKVRHELRDRTEKALDEPGLRPTITFLRQIGDHLDGPDTHREADSALRRRAAAEARRSRT